MSGRKESHEVNEAANSKEHEKDFKKEIAKFLFKRLVDANFKNFKFTRGKKGLGKFDDLTYIYETEDGQKKFGLLQLEHISDKSETIGYETKNSYFWLPEYYEYYLDCMRTIRTDKDFADAELEGLFLCTNIGPEDYLREIQKQQLDNDELFKDSGVLYKLTISNTDKRNIFKDSYTSRTKRLANELTKELIMCNKHIDINSLKKNDHVSMLKAYHVSLTKDVIDVEAKKFKTNFLDTDLENSGLRKFRDCLFESVSEFCETYKEFSAEELHGEFKIGLKKSEELRNRISMYKTMNSAEDFLKKQAIKIDKSFGDVKKYSDDDIKLPEEELTDDEVESEINYFLDKLIFALEQQDNKSITKREISEMSNNMFNDYNKRVKMWYDEGSYEEKDSKGLKIRKRDWLTKENLVSNAMEATVKFQGRDLKLKQLVFDENLLDPNLLLCIFCSLNVTIGNKIRGITDPTTKYCYISRDLMKQKVILKNILTTREDIFLLSHIKDDSDKKDIMNFIPKRETLDHMENITEKSRFIFTGCDFEAKDFDNLVETYSEKLKWTNIHWVKYEGDKLLWKRTHGSELEVRNYFNNDHASELVNESDLCKNDRFVILIGEPGMGKSVLTDKIAENFGENNGEKETPDWIIKISLKDCDKKLDEIESLDNFDRVAEFISFFENVENNFGKNLLKHCFTNGDRVTLLLDGFDELQSKDKRKKIIDFLKFLKLKSRVKRVCITTRTHFKEDLEDSLGVISYSIKEISEEEQVSFLTRYWTRKKESSSASEKHLLDYTKELIKKFNRSTSARDRSFLGIPLQTYMFAVAFHEETLKDNPDIPESLPITTLFEKFLNTKYDLYFERSGENINNKDYKLKWYDIHHQEFALLYGGVFSSEEAELFITSDNLEDEEILLLTEIGIIYRFNDTFYFTHKTFAEYLIVKFLVRVSSNPKKTGSNRKKGMAKLFLKPGNEFVRYLFDLKLTENYPIHNSMMNKEEMEISDEKINDEDCLGRRPLNYAVRYRTFNFVRSIRSKGALVGKDWEHWVQYSELEMESDKEKEWRDVLWKKTLNKVLKAFWKKEWKKHWKDPGKSSLDKDMKDSLKGFLSVFLNDVLKEMLKEVLKAALMVFLIESSDPLPMETLKKISKTIWEDASEEFWGAISKEFGTIAKEVGEELGKEILGEDWKNIPEEILVVILKTVVGEIWKEVWEEEREKVWNSVWDEVENEVLSDVSRGTWMMFVEKDWGSDSELDSRRIQKWLRKMVKEKVLQKKLEDDLRLNIK